MAVAWRLERSRKDLERATRDNERLREENERLRREREQLQREIEELEHERDRYKGERRAREGAGGGAPRGQAASGAFLEGRPTLTPRRPGAADQATPTDRTRGGGCRSNVAGVEVLRPGACPVCSGNVGVEAVRVHYQADLPPVRRFVTAFHWAAWLHTGLAVPFAKVATILRTGFGLAITPGGLATLACSCATAGRPIASSPTPRTSPASRASCVAPTSCSRRRSAGRRAPPHAVRRLLLRTLALRERRERGELEGRGLRIALDRLEAHTDRALAGRVTHAPNRRLLRRLRTERPALFICVRRTDVEATDWQAEHAVQPAVVTREVCGGDRDPLDRLVALQRSPHPVVTDFRLPGLAPP